MSVQTYGLVGQPNVTLTMFNTFDEDAQLSVNDSGEKLPPNVVTKRKLTFARHRLGMHVTRGDKTQSAELPGIFPLD